MQQEYQPELATLELIVEALPAERARDRNCVVLCTTHHHLLHDGELELSGDAEGELCFRDAQGRPLVEHDLEGDRFVGHTPSFGELPTGNDGNGNGGCSPRNNGADHPTTHSGSPSHPAAERLLDAVAAAFTELELRRNIRYGDFTYEPI